MVSSVCFISVQVHGFISSWTFPCKPSWAHTAEPIVIHAHQDQRDLLSFYTAFHPAASAGSTEVGKHHYSFSTGGKLRNVCRNAPVHGHTAGQKRAGKGSGACGFTGCSVYKERLHCKENVKFIDAEIIVLAKDGITVSYISAIHSKSAWLLNSSRFQGCIFYAG